MGTTLKLTIFFLGAVFVGYVIYLLVKRKIDERNSFFWLAGSLVILALSTMPDIIEIIANLVGVDYPPTLLFVLSILIILFILLYQSIQISMLQARCKELAQHIAIMKFSKELPAAEKIISSTHNAGEERRE